MTVERGIADRDFYCRWFWMLLVIAILQQAMIVNGWRKDEIGNLRPEDRVAAPVQP